MRYVIGDIHGCYDKMISALEYSGFNPSKGDTLYSLGDLCDRGEKSSAVLNYIYLLNQNYKNSFKAVFGNHDIWLYQHWDSKLNKVSMTRDAWEVWEHNGGKSTIQDTKNMNIKVIRKIFTWLSKLPYRIELDDYILQHTTIRSEELLLGNDPTKLTLKYCLDNEICSKDYDSWFWDRNIIQSSKELLVNGQRNNSQNKPEYTTTKKPLIIGHTPILGAPLYDKSLNIISMDTGSFIKKEIYKTDIDGEICVINLDTKEWFMSDGNEGILEV